MPHYLDGLLLCFICSALIRIKSENCGKGGGRSIAIAVTTRVLNQFFKCISQIIHGTSRTSGFKTNSLYAALLSCTKWVPAAVTLQEYGQQRPGSKFGLVISYPSQICHNVPQFVPQISA